MDKDARGSIGVDWPIGDPLIYHHEDQVPEQAEHEGELRDENQEHAAYLPKVPVRQTDRHTH